MNESGSRFSTGYSSSNASSKRNSGSDNVRVRISAPRARRCKRAPACPRREANACSGSKARVRKSRTPQRSRVSSICSRNLSRSRMAAACGVFARGRSKESSSTCRGRTPRRRASSPTGSTVAPVNPQAACMAESGLPAIATLASRPAALIRDASSRAMFTAEPCIRSMPHRSSNIRSSAVSSTRGENPKAASSSAECADFSCSRERWRRTASPKIAACNFVIPASIPICRAGSFNAMMRTTGGLPSRAAMARSRSSGSVRTMASTGKSGM